MDARDWVSQMGLLIMAAQLDADRRAIEAALLSGKNPEDPIAGNESFYADGANKLTRGGPG